MRDKCAEPDFANLDQHIALSMIKRHWTILEISEAYEQGELFPSVDLTSNNAAACRFVHPTTGKSVVINQATGRIIHVGGTGLFTEAQLPQELQAGAFVYKNEFAWQASGALNVLTWLESQGVPVFGVELWRNQDGFPLWIATHSGSWRTVAESVQEARQFIEDFQDYQGHPGNLFNLDWGSLPPAASRLAEAS